MTKKVLLECISESQEAMERMRGSRLEPVDNESKIKVCKELHDNASKILAGLHDESELGDLYSLEEISSAKKLKDYLSRSTPDTIARQGDRLCAELMTMMKNSVDLSTAETIQMIDKRRAFIMRIIISTIGVLVVLLVVLQILGICNVLSSEFNEIISTVIGALDLILGFVFFVYEHHSDNDKTLLRRQAEEAKKEDPSRFLNYYGVPQNNIVLGDGNVVVNGNNNKVKKKTTIVKVREYYDARK